MIPDSILAQLTTRFCACGCGMSFRVFPSSPSLYASRDHLLLEPTDLQVRRSLEKKAKMQEPLPPGWVDLNTLCRAVGTQKTTVYNWVRDKLVPSKKFGKRRGFQIEAVRRALAHARANPKRRGRKRSY